MDEMTEREKKLLEYLQKCLNIITALALYRKYSFDAMDWLTKAAEVLKIADTQTEIMDLLKTEFGIEAKIIDPYAKEENG